MTKRSEATTPREESIAVAFENVALCALAIAAQLRNPNGTAVIPKSCKDAGVDLGDLADGEASATFVVVAIETSVEESQ